MSTELKIKEVKDVKKLDDIDKADLVINLLQTQTEENSCAHLGIDVARFKDIVNNPANEALYEKYQKYVIEDYTKLRKGVKIITKEVIKTRLQQISDYEWITLKEKMEKGEKLDIKNFKTVSEMQSDFLGLKEQYSESKNVTINVNTYDPKIIKDLPEV